MTAIEKWDADMGIVRVVRGGMTYIGCQGIEAFQKFGRMVEAEQKLLAANEYERERMESLVKSDA